MLCKVWYAVTILIQQERMIIMKRYLILLMALALLCLWGCNKETSYEGTTPPAQETPVPEQNPTPDDEKPKDEQTNEDPVPEILYRNPLNGAPLEEAWEGRPVAVVINNIEDALPHYGTSEADFIFEAETESGITRMLAVYDEMKDIDRIGPVRSSRSFFNNLALNFDAPIIHCGGSTRGRKAGYENSDKKIENWAHIDATYYESSYFYRDNDRYKYQGYNWEHCLFTNSELLQKGLTKFELLTPTTRSSDFGLQFEEEVLLTGETANTVKVTFRAGKTTSFTYDAQQKLYKTAQYGADYIDAAVDKIVTFRNVIALYVDQTIVNEDGYPRSYYDLQGEGVGHLAIDGKIVPIKWSRQDVNSNFVFSLEDGTEVTLASGHTYVAITSNDDTQYS